METLPSQQNASWNDDEEHFPLQVGDAEDGWQRAEVGLSRPRQTSSITLKMAMLGLGMVCVLAYGCTLFVTAIHFTMKAKAESSSHEDEPLQGMREKTPLPLPLKPPFRIAEYSQPRSGSTFQFHMLDAMAQLKNKGSGYEMENMGYEDYVSKKIHSYPESFIVKSHKWKDVDVIEKAKQGELVIFTSGFDPEDERYSPFFQVSLFNQDKDDLERCSDCQVDYYRHLFDLTDEEVGHVKEYLDVYTQIRRCCGLQMSHFEAARLNGCNMTLAKQDPGYPFCENIDKQDAEQRMVNSPIPHRKKDSNDTISWVRPGDCEKFDKIIASGKGFNGKPFIPEKDCPAV